MEIRRHIFGNTTDTYVNFAVPLISSASRPQYAINASAITVDIYWSDGSTWYANTYLEFVTAIEVGGAGIYDITIDDPSLAAFQAIYDRQLPIIIKIQASGCDEQTVLIIDDSIANQDNTWIASSAQLANTESNNNSRYETIVAKLGNPWDLGGGGDVNISNMIHDLAGHTFDYSTDSVEAGLKKADAVDTGITVVDALQFMTAMFNGNFTVDDTTDQITFEDRDGATLSVVGITAGGRTRIS
jgi:hypothetical protein